MIICEIGLNHLGDTKYANQIVDEIIKAKPDAITFQIREETFYVEKPFSKLRLSDSFYKKIIKKIKNSGIKFGVSLADETKVEFCRAIQLGVKGDRSAIMNDNLLKIVDITGMHSLIYNYKNLSTFKML